MALSDFLVDRMDVEAAKDKSAGPLPAYEPLPPALPCQIHELFAGQRVQAALATATTSSTPAPTSAPSASSASALKAPSPRTTASPARRSAVGRRITLQIDKALAADLRESTLAEPEHFAQPLTSYRDPTCIDDERLPPLGRSHSYGLSTITAC